MRVISMKWLAVEKSRPEGRAVYLPGHSKLNWFKLSLLDSPETALFTIVWLIKGTFGDLQYPVNKHQGRGDKSCM